jgi:hypothetical protein
MLGIVVVAEEIAATARIRPRRPSLRSAGSGMVSRR